MSKILVYGTLPVSENTEPIVYRDLIVTRNMKRIHRILAFEDFSLIIIDLEGRGKKGMELASDIRSIPRQCMTPILFLSKDHKLEWDAFHKYHGYDFFIKPITTQNILTILCLALQNDKSGKPVRTIMVSNGAKRYPVRIDDILYVECLNRNTIIHTASSEIGVPALHLSDIMKTYTTDFIQIHRSTVVNRNQIRCVNAAQSIIELKNSHEQLPIGKTYVPVIRKIFDGI